MHVIQGPKFIITIGEHFFPDKPVHKQIAKFYCIKFEGSLWDTIFFLRACIEI